MIKGLKGSAWTCAIPTHYILAHPGPPQPMHKPMQSYACLNLFHPCIWIIISYHPNPLSSCNHMSSCAYVHAHAHVYLPHACIVLPMAMSSHAMVATSSGFLPPYSPIALVPPPFSTLLSTCDLCKKLSHSWLTLLLTNCISNYQELIIYAGKNMFCKHILWQFCVLVYQEE